MTDKNSLFADELLTEWLAVTSLIQNERIVKHMSYNEALVCNYLWHQLGEENDCLTPTRLCKMTGIKKSLMNRIIKSLEEKELIEYVKIGNDRRTTPIRFNIDKEDYFMQEHNNSIKVVEQIVEAMGNDKAEKVLQSLRDINAGAKTVFGIE